MDVKSMDESLKQGCKEMIELAIKVRPEINLKSFYEKMKNYEIDNEVFASSDKTIRRYLKSNKGEGKNFDRFLQYSTEILGMKVDTIIEVAKVWIRYKGSIHEKECIDKIELYFKRLIIVPKLRLQSLSGFGAWLEFYEKHNKDEIGQFEDLNNKCLKLSREMRRFLIKLFSDEIEDINDISKIKKRLSNARIRVNTLEVHRNKDFRILFEIQCLWSIQNDQIVNKKYNNTAGSDELLWILRYYSALEEKNEKLDMILKYALLNPEKNSKWRIS